MKVTLYNAISIDGFIARSDHKTDWVSDTDWEIFTKLVKSKKAIVMGRKTWETSKEDFPYNCELNIVMTRNKKLIAAQTQNDPILFTNLDSKEVIEEVEKRGYSELLIIGGGKLNSSFLKANLIDEIIIDIHPTILGKGVKLFGDQEFDINLKRTKVTQLEEGLVQIVYQKH